MKKRRGKEGWGGIEEVGEEDGEVEEEEEGEEEEEEEEEEVGGRGKKRRRKKRRGRMNPSRVQRSASSPES